MLAGEQSGDNEDRQGRPFIGPVGQLLDEVLAGVGLDRQELCVTNAVKHLGWMGDEKQRLHAKPGRREVLPTEVPAARNLRQGQPWSASATGRMISVASSTAASAS